MVRRPWTRYLWTTCRIQRHKQTLEENLRACAKAPSQTARTALAKNDRMNNIMLYYHYATLYYIVACSLLLLGAFTWRMSRQHGPQDSCAGCCQRHGAQNFGRCHSLPFIPRAVLRVPLWRGSVTIIFWAGGGGYPKLQGPVIPLAWAWHQYPFAQTSVLLQLLLLLYFVCCCYRFVALSALVPPVLRCQSANVLCCIDGCSSTSRRRQ